MDLLNRMNYVLDGDDAVSFTEIVIWISVILVIIGLLLVMKDTIENFLSLRIKKVGNMGPKY